jgi:hypothetical protein
MNLEMEMARLEFVMLWIQMKRMAGRCNMENAMTKGFEHSVQFELMRR